MSIPPYRFASLAIAVATFAMFLILGRAVDHAPDPGWIMIYEIGWVNHSTLIAWWFTCCGYPYVLVPVCLISIVIAIRYPQWRSRVTFAIVSLLIAWQGTDAWQHFFWAPAPFGLGTQARDVVLVPELAYGDSDGLLSLACGLCRPECSAGQSLVCLRHRSARTRDHVVEAGPRSALPDRYRWGILWGSTIVAALAACWPTTSLRGERLRL